MSIELKPRQDFLETALACGATLTGKPDGSEAISVVFTIDAWRKLDSAIQQAEVTQAEVTDELCWQIWDKAGACDEVNERVTLKVAKPIIRAIVAAYLEVAATRGITAQAKKETP